MGDRWKDHDNTEWQGGLRSRESTEAGSLNQTGLGQGSRYMLEETHKSCPNARMRVTHMQKEEGEAWSWSHLYKKVTENQAGLRILFGPSQPPSCHNTHKNVKMLIWHLRIWGCLQVNRYMVGAQDNFEMHDTLEHHDCYLSERINMHVAKAQNEWWNLDKEVEK